MRVRLFTLALVALLSMAALPCQAADDDSALYDRLTTSKAGAIVSVKLTLTVKITFQGNAMPPRQINQAATGIIVDPSGLVMVPASLVDVAGMLRGMRGAEGVESSTVPSDIRVIFPGDTREYAAILGAKDSKLGLAFLLIKDLEGKAPVSLDLSKKVDPRVGQTLYGVSRLEEGFDHAAVVGRARVVGTVTKPRDMWVLEGAGENIGEPLYTEDGAVAGVVSMQQAVGGEDQRLFLLPLKIAVPTIERALKGSQDELNRIRDEEAEAKANEKPAEPEKPAQPEKPAEPEKPDGEGSSDK